MRMQFIAPIIMAVVSTIPGMKTELERDIDGATLNFKAHFEFVLTRGEKRVFVLHAKDGLIDKSELAEKLLSLEVAAECHASNAVCGIITNFKEWIFVKSLDEKILIDSGSKIGMDSDRQLKSAGVREVTGKIYSLL